MHPPTLQRSTRSEPRVHTIPALDGIRGAAIISVLAYHLSIWAARGLPRNSIQTLASFGYSGVDLFFVLSGFLITGILLDARGAPRWLRTFYIRRVLRIFPLYYAAVAAAIPPGRGSRGPKTSTRSPPCSRGSGRTRST